jgi:hypothetical protein
LAAIATTATTTTTIAANYMAVVMAMASMGIVSALTAQGWAVLVQIALIRTILAEMILAAMILAAMILAAMILAAMILAAMILAAMILEATILARNPGIAHLQGAKVNAMAQGARKLPASASIVSTEAV